MRQTLVVFFILALAACAIQPQKPAVEHLNLTRVSFADLAGWEKDASVDALMAFKKSCPILTHKPADASLGIVGKNANWHGICLAAAQTAQTNDEARAFFEENFFPYVVANKDETEGLFTGYYVPELRGSLQRGSTFQTPLYARPTDMVAVDLGVFKNDLKGQHIVGKVADNNLIPYDDRATIVENSLANRAQPIVWIDDPVGAFFLEVQGSGHIRLTDGSVFSVGYDGTNGRAYVAIGRVLADRGELPRPVTMPSIRAWLAANPDRAQDVMNVNPSYVFFRRLSSDEVIGAEGVGLSPQRSVAVDPAFIPLGLPLWLDTIDGQGASFQHLMIAQDTGGAIKGPVRGDVFWGAGFDAERQAGAMQSRGRYYVLLPKMMAVNDNER